jgi:hypothetical protein
MTRRLAGSLFSVTTLLVLIVGMGSPRPSAAPRFSAWTTPVNLGPVVNSSADDQAPAISKDGLSLYFASRRGGGFGGNDMWVTRRDSEDSLWGPPMNLGAVVNSASNDGAMTFSRDEHWMFFHSNRPGGFGRADLYAAWRADTHDPFGWESVVNLGATVNSAFPETEPGFLESMSGVATLFFSSDRGEGTSFDLYITTQTPSGAFTPPVRLEELSSPVNDAHPSIRFDGLEIFFNSGRADGLSGGMAEELWAATRNTPSDAWSAPVNLGPVVNSALFSNIQPAIASDRQTLYFASNRGGSGGFDLYYTTREKVPGRR